MSFAPIRMACRALHQAAASIAILRRFGAEYVDVRFSPDTLRAAGWHRGLKVAPFVDLEAGQLLFASAGPTDSSGRSLTAQGGNQLSARWCRIGQLREIIPDLPLRRPVRVIRAGAGQVVVDLHSIRSSTPVPSLP